MLGTGFADNGADIHNSIIPGRREGRDGMPLAGHTTFVWMVVFLAVFAPPTFRSTTLTNTLVMALQLGSLIYVLAMWAVHGLDAKISFIHTFAGIAYLVTLILSTALSDGLLSSLLSRALVWVLVFVAVAIFCHIDPQRCMTAVKWALFLYILANAISLLLYPEAMFYSVTGMKNWLLGDRNLFGLYVLPLMIVSLLDDLLRDRWLSKFTIICSVLGIAELLYVFSATSITSVSVFVIGLVIMRFFPRVSSTVMIYIWSVAMPAVLFFAIVIFRLQERFAWFIEGVLGKTLTFTGRTAIWDYVIDSFSSSPAMGHGLHAYIATLNGFDFAHAHDLYLNVLYNSGVVGLGCLLLFLLMSIAPLTRASGDVQVVLSVGLGAILTMMTFEYSYYPGFLLVFCLAFVSPELRGGREPSVLRERDRVGVPFISRAVTRA